jgi:hypothetical protein
MSESDLFEDDIFSFFEFFPCEIIECPIKIEKLFPCEILVEVGVLRHESYTFADIYIIDRTAKYLGYSLCRLHDTEDTLHGCRFSSAIWPEKSENLSFFDREIYISEEGCFSDFFREMLERDDRFHSLYFSDLYADFADFIACRDVFYGYIFHRKITKDPCFLIDEVCMSRVITFIVGFPIDPRETSEHTLLGHSLDISVDSRTAYLGLVGTDLLIDIIS